MASKDKPEQGSTPEKGDKPAKKPAAEKKPAAAASKKKASEGGSGKPPAKKADAPKKPAAVGKAKPDARAVAKYIRTAPRKLRLVVDAIRGRSVEDARNILNFARKRAARTLVKVLNSAVANAENNHELDPERLFVSSVFVDQGPAIKRFIPRARGRASGVKKYTSHVTIELKVREEGR